MYLLLDTVYQIIFYKRFVFPYPFYITDFHETVFLLFEVYWRM